MKSVLKLIRVPNLIIIALTMCLLRYFLIGKMLDLRQMWPGLSDTNFTLLTLSVMCIAAAGYIINDYFDLAIDAINKPEKIVIGRSISKTNAFTVYLLLNALGIILSMYVAYKIHHLSYALINVVSAGLLWFYSNTYKKTVLIGNIVIAVLSALVPLMVGMFEPNKGKHELEFILTYAAFAFVITMIREIIKDIEDMEGDEAYGANTLPLVIGVAWSKFIAIVLSLALLSFLGYVEYNQYITEDRKSLLYFVFAISLPIVVLIFWLPFARKKAQFHKLSTLSKLIMLTGIFSSVVFYYSF